MKELIPLPDNKVDQFIAEYYTRLKIPTALTCKPFIICPVGRIKSGKTTLTSTLEEQLGACRISLDTARIMLRIENNYHSSEYKKIIPTIVDRVITQKVPFIIDSSCASLWTRELVEKISEQYNIPLIWIHVNPTDEWIIEKLKHFKYEKNQIFTGPKNAIRRFKEHLLDFPDISDIPFEYAIDSSQEDYIENIKEIGLKIYKKYQL